MTLLDWLVVAAYVAMVVVIGVWFTRRGGTSTEQYLVAGRKLPWWVIGLSDVASGDGADAFWVMVLFAGAFMGLYRVWWVAYVVALPLGVLWARYWRRLRLVSPGQIYEVRYGGRAAGLFRGFFALYGALVANCIVLAYVLKGFAQIMEPFLGLPEDLVLLVFCGVSVLYTMLSGLLGVAYSDVPQFILIMLGRVLLAVLVVHAAGGMGAVLDGVEALRGADFLKAMPPSAAEGYGDYAVEPLSLLALVLAGFFGVAGTQSVAVQRSLAARSEADAAWGQVFNAVLTLVVRMAPLVVVGLAAAAYYVPDADGTQLWMDMVKRNAAPGLLGLLLVGVVAGYMSTIDTYLNFTTAGLLNDFYRRHVRPKSSDREQVLFGRVATIAVTIAAYVWARLLMDRIDDAWLNFINSVIGLFMLPLALLRWTWWRLNIWGEIVGFVGSFPLAYVVWFVLDFKESPYWMSFVLLFGVGWVVILAVTLLTPAESPETLRAFYRRVRPPGWWRPVAGEASAEQQDLRRRELKLDIATAVAGLGFCSGLVVGLSAGISRQWALLVVALTAIGLGGALFVRWTRRAETVRSEIGAAAPEGAHGD